MVTPYDEGTKVTWNWGNGTGSGTVKKVHTERVERTIEGSEIVRNADEENPAYTIKTDDDDEVLKSHSELDRA